MNRFFSIYLLSVRLQFLNLKSSNSVRKKCFVLVQKKLKTEKNNRIIYFNSKFFLKKGTFEGK